MANKKRDVASVLLGKAAGDPRLTTSGMRILLLVIAEDDGGGVRITLTDLAKRLGLSRCGAFDGQKQCRDAGYISRSGRANEASTYKLAA